MKKNQSSTMLECWRPPTGAGDPVGCMAATFTFDSGFFEEECLSRFLDINSHPDKEGLAYILERENMLGCVYAGVLSDFQQAGADHSLRWDILPIRIPGRCQHAKISILAWAEHIRIIVSSANLTPSGYRSNQEIAGTLDFSRDGSDHEQLDKCCLFLKELMTYMPSVSDEDAVSNRAKNFLDTLPKIAADWAPENPRSNQFRKILIFTHPEPQKMKSPAIAKLNGGTTLSGCLDNCIKFGGGPSAIKVASPFFNQNTQKDHRDEVTIQLCKRMARNAKRALTFSLPLLNNGDGDDAAPRLAAPRSLFNAAVKQVNRLFIESLPAKDEDDNFRPWHAKMIWLENESYAALMIGSSNFTSPAMGLLAVNNAEANLLYLARQKAFAKHIGDLRQCWPSTKRIHDIENIEWTGLNYPLGEQDIQQSTLLPEGFIAARFLAGAEPEIHLYFHPEKLPVQWKIFAGTSYSDLIFDHEAYHLQNRPPSIRFSWKGQQTPGKLRVQWGENQTFWTVNVENDQSLPLAPEINAMSVHDLMCILSAHDYSMAVRAWAQKRRENRVEEEMDDAAPPELDPLKRYRLNETFLHRIRMRARMLAGVCKNLQRPVWSEKALRWRLEGILGIKLLSEKLAASLEDGSESPSEAVFHLADFFSMLNEVKYDDAPGAIEKSKFEMCFRPFCRHHIDAADAKITACKARLPQEICNFWKKTYERCSSR